MNIPNFNYFFDFWGNKTHLVNLKQVTAYIRDNGGSLILSNGDQVAVSRRRKDLVKEKLKMRSDKFNLID